MAGLPSLPAIDLHCHIGTMPEQPSTCIGADGMQREYERFNIEYGVVSATSAYKDDLDAGNVEMLAAVESHSRLRGSVVANPHHWDDSLRWLDLAAEHPDILHVTVNPSYHLRAFPLAAVAEAVRRDRPPPAPRVLQHALAGHLQAVARGDDQGPHPEGARRAG